MIHQLKFNLFMAGILMIFAACSDDKEDLLRGTWEKINVADINASHTYEWRFEDGEVTVFRRSNSDPLDVVITDQGFYLLESSIIKTELRLLEMSNEIWNDRWDVIELTRKILVLNLDIKGGVMFWEFQKIN